ncbi:hypothetical protein BGZ99_000137 [Dissophora globulifera]|uniref:F-box domain-containing protein n=1 Tax=Dissophora globulifera TaxID=979702 RepID=A0A9P6R1K7_9FUNG|nr:hypothetical protein BGZ99_000137 [Dissophora globulifera]
MTSPLDLPELLSLVASHLEAKDLARACRVSVLFHNACTPFLWRTVSLVANRATRVWIRDRGFRVGLIHYGPFVRTLCLNGIHVRDKYLMHIAVNCTRLKSLDLSSTNVTAENLKVLLHSDPYKTSLGFTDKPDDGLMERFRGMKDSKRDMDRIVSDHPHEGAGLPSSSTDSERERHKLQLTRPVLTVGPRYTSNRIRLITPGHNTGGQGGTTHLVKAQFPFQLEELTFAHCEDLYGYELFPVLALLGPQLRSLSITDLEGIEVPDFIRLLKHCPNLTRLNLAGTDGDDDLLKALAGSTEELAPRAMELLDLSMAPVKPDSLIPLIQVSRDKLQQLSCSDTLYINDDVIYAFIEDAKHLSKAPRPVKSFMRNDVLSVLQMNSCGVISNDAFLELFRHTTALTIVSLNDSEIEDDALEALAAASRDRMERLGLGIPEAWIQHEHGEFKFMAEQQKDAKQLPAPAAGAALSAGRKLYDGVWVPGGLQRLSLENCVEVTNRGIRAIVRSCPTLEELDLGGCEGVSIQVFRGPWVCNKLQNLNISGINVHPRIRTMSMSLEEEIENERFPLTRLLKTHPSDDFRDDGQYDFMNPPMGMSREFELRYDDDIPDEDEPAQEDQERTIYSRNNMYPAKVYRNNGETRRTLNEFYRKLGQFDRLKSLNMAKSNYRIRIQDGLDLVLPALTKNLRVWNMCRTADCILQNAELKWFGKHFGYGFDYSTDKDELKRQRKIKDEYKRSYDDDEPGPVEGDLNRVSKLATLELSKNSFDESKLDKKLYKWFMESGFDVCLLDDWDMNSDDDELYLDDDGLDLNNYELHLGLNDFF